MQKKRYAHRAYRPFTFWALSVPPKKIVDPSGVRVDRIEKERWSPMVELHFLAAVAASMAYRGY